jgi:acyl carrier protein
MTAHSLEEIRAAVVAALLATRADQGDPVLVDEQTAIGRAGLGLSSLNVLQALVRIEDVLGIVFDDRAVAETPLRSVGTLVDLAAAAPAAEGA